MIPGVDNDSIVYLNGDYVRLGDAKISVLDRGFIFGDGIYEVVPCYGGKPFLMQNHLARLQRSLKAIRLETGRGIADWEALVADMLSRSGARGDCSVYLQVTRGVAKRDHGFPADSQATVFCMVSPLKRPNAHKRGQGMTAVSMPDERWLHCEIKSVSLLGNVLAKQYAADAGVDEVLQFRDGNLSEGSSCNIWVVKNGVMRAPVRDNLILEGIRYGFLEQLAADAGIPFESRPIPKAEVAEADELMLSSATKEVLPITQYDGRPVGSGTPGPVYARLRAAYDQAIAAL
ncbi:D-amino acid aminotransferase [uncultured Castellaniella sp.]|uniref:D-amino acid aminotransferase n=1 Tax=uncultured Castellaniella sp. TaxID=647907 RepID=UPI00263463A6|nr:D-amino acid aminotransferase [uncultured Castellaniella sp.]